MLLSVSRVADRALLFEKLAQLQHGGVTLLESLPLVTGGVSDPELRRALSVVRVALGEGVDLAESLRRARAFTPLEQALIAAGEANGRLDRAFADLARLHQVTCKSATKVRAALAYPAFLLCLGLLLPSAATWYTRGLGAYLGEVLGAAWPLLLIGALIWAALRYGRAAAPLVVDRVILLIPLVGGVARRLALSRFCRALSSLIAAGVELRAGVELSFAAMGNRDLGSGAAAALSGLDRGLSLAESLSQTGSLPDELLSRVMIGERAGTLTETLDRAADQYDEEAQGRLTALLRALPILLFLLVALRIASQVVGFYQGYFDSIDRAIEGNLGDIQ